MGCNCSKKTAIRNTGHSTKQTTPKKTGAESRTTRRIIRRATH